MNTNIEILVPGKKADVFVYKDDRGEIPVILFMNQLSNHDRAKIAPLLQRFSEFGEIRNEEKFKLEEKPIYAFKSYQIRLLCFFLPKASKKTIVITHGFIKKKKKIPKIELEKAKSIFDKITNNN